MARVLPGQHWKPETAAQRNRWDESSEFYALKKRLRDKIPDQRVPVPTEMDVIKVQNLTGAQRSESEVVQLGAEIISNVTRLHPWLEGNTPDSRCERYAVLRYPTGINRIRWAQVSGPTLAMVDLTNGNKRCSPAAGLYHFVGDDDGPIEILWAPTEDSGSGSGGESGSGDGIITGVHECLVEMEQVVPPSNYVAKIPECGIPARDGDLVGRAVCEIYRLSPHDYTGPEAKNVEPILKPNGDRLTKEIYNLSLRGITACGDDTIYLPVHREECGNWFVSGFEPLNYLYDAELTEPLCPSNRGFVGITSVTPLQGPEPEYVTAQITQAKNRYGRAQRGNTGDGVLVLRVYRPQSGSCESGGGLCDHEFWIIQVTPKCIDMPVTREDCSGSGNNNGQFIFRDGCGSGSGEDQIGSGSGDGCAPIQGYVLPDCAIETCSDEPEIVDQIELEMFDGIADMNMDGCPEWINFAFCGFSNCAAETDEAAECEPCPDESGSGA